MDDAVHQIFTAATQRAIALSAGDVEQLEVLLHPHFRWTTHLGETYSRSEYIRRNTNGSTVWRSQHLNGRQVVVVGDTAVLYAEATDVVKSGDHEAETLRMPITQVWIRMDQHRLCLAGHAGPRRS